LDEYLVSFLEKKNIYDFFVNGGTEKGREEEKCSVEGAVLKK
jgi:hypothetical protein